MSLEISDIIERARVAAADAQKDGKTTSDEREKLKGVAQEFESMLLVQMLKDMRKSGAWEDSDSEDKEENTFGAETMYEQFDVEMATFLSKAKSLGLQDQLLQAFDRLQPQTAPVAPTTESGAAPATLPALPALKPLAPISQPVVATTPQSMNGVPPRGQEVEALMKPVSGAVTSQFGWRRDPFTNQLKFHQGIDMRAAYGQDVQAAGAGTVVFSGHQGGYGTSVVIEHADGTRTRYAHLSAALVEKGQKVDAGQAVGQAGHSGRATGTHLHFEVIGRDGRRMEPQQWARADAAGRTLPGTDSHGSGI